MAQTQARNAEKTTEHRASGGPTPAGSGDSQQPGTSETNPRLPLVADLIPDEDESPGYDPYNSGSFDSTKYKKSGN